MKKLSVFIAFLSWGITAAWGQLQAPSASLTCELERQMMGYPYHYCNCWEQSSQFAFPLSLEIQPGDTLWYTAAVDQLKQGLSAYWFSSSSVVIEVYALCASDVPTISLEVGPNQMREMDVAKINKKIDEMGSATSSMINAITPHIRVYVKGNNPGKVYCYPYDQGPRSTCNDVLSLLPHMTYVCDSTYEVYELKPNQISSTTGNGFIRWQQKRNEPATITLRADNCSGQVIGQRTLSDSSRVFVLDPTMLRTMKQAGRSIFVEVQHDPGLIGRIWYYNTIQKRVNQVDTTICQGMSVELPDTTFYESTNYNDTLHVAQDTLSYSLFHLSVTPPDTISDTLRVKASKLPMIYRNQERIAKDGWGDHAFLIHSEGTCDEFVNLHVERVWNTQTIIVDTTICEGKSYAVSGQSYSTDTQIKDSAWTNNGDTWTIRDITIHFSSPEMEYDTITLKPSEIAGEGYYYAEANQMITAFGDMEFTITARNKCTRRLTLTVLQGEDENPSEGLSHPEQAPRAAIYVGADGVLYVRRGEQLYTILGNKIQ